jgi:hypothetical protein
MLLQKESPDKSVLLSNTNVKNHLAGPKTEKFESFKRKEKKLSSLMFNFFPFEL